MKCSACATPFEKSMYFALEHDAHDIMRVHGGYVYFWAAEDWAGETFVKIGHTTNLEQRLAAFKRAKTGVIVPDGIDMQGGGLYGVISGGHRLEKLLHSAFRDEHELGEWFHLSDRLAFIIEVLLDEWCADPCCSDAQHLERRAHDAAMRDAMDGLADRLVGDLDGALSNWDDSEDEQSPEAAA